MTIKKGIAVLNGTTVVHSMKDDGDALIGKNGQRVDLKGSVYVDGVTDHAGKDLATTLNDVAYDASYNTMLESQRSSDAIGALGKTFAAGMKSNAEAHATNEQDLIDEEVRATAAEGVNANALTTQSSAAQAVESQFSTDTGLQTIAATTAETVNANAITARNTSATTAEATLGANITARTSAAQSAEAAIQSDVDQNEADFDAAIAAREAAAKSAESTLTTNLSQQSSDAESAEDDNAADLLEQSQAAQSAEGTLTSDLNSQSSNAIFAESLLASNAAAEKTRAETAESGLQAQLDVISDVLNDPTGIETFRDVVSAINSADASVSAANVAMLETHNNDRTAAIAASIVRTDALQSTVDSDESSFDQYVADEQTRAEAAEAYFAGELADQNTDATDAESALQSDVDQNEADFDAAVAAVLADAQANQVSFNQAWKAEDSRAGAVRKTLEQALAAQNNAAEAAEGTLTSTIGDENSGEQMRASDAEYFIQQDVDQNEADFDAAIAAVAQDEANNDASFLSDANALGQALAQDYQNASDAAFNIAQDEDQNEADFDFDMNAEALRAITVEGTNAAAVVTEEARAKAAESANATAISDEAARADAAEKANAAAITAEESRATAAEQANATAIAAQTAAAIAAELVLTNDFNTEVARANAADTAISADLSILQDVTSPAVAGSLKEVVDAITALSASQASDLAAMIVTYTTELGAQTAASIAAIDASALDEEDNLSDAMTAISDEEARAVTAEDQLGVTFQSHAEARNNYVWSQYFSQAAALGEYLSNGSNDGSTLGLPWSNVWGDTYAGLDSMSAESVELTEALQLSGYQGEADFTDATMLANGDFDGMTFYYNGTASADFPVSNKHYFCEAGAWYGSPFYTPPTTVDTTALFAAIDAAEVFLASGSTSGYVANQHVTAINTEYAAIATGAGAEFAIETAVVAQYGVAGHNVAVLADLDLIINPPQPSFNFRVTDPTGYHNEVFVIADGVALIAPTMYGLGGIQMPSATYQTSYELPAEDSYNWELSDHWGDGEHFLEFLKSDGSTAATVQLTAGYKYSDGQTLTVTVDWDGTDLYVNGAAVMTWNGSAWV